MQSNINESVIEKTQVSVVNCPNGGTCTIEVLKNKELATKTINNGLLYEITDNPNTTVIRYQYSKNMHQVEYGGGYREEVLFEINNSENKIELANKELQNVKMLYGRYCNCRGTTGIFQIENGTLNLTKKSNKISFTLDYKTSEIPQVISKIVVEDNVLH